MSDSFATPWIVACQVPLSMGFPRQEYQNGLPFPSPGDLSDPGIEPTFPALQADSLPPRHVGSTSLCLNVTFLCGFTRLHFSFSPSSPTPPLIPHLLFFPSVLVTSGHSTCFRFEKNCLSLQIMYKLREGRIFV